MKKLIITAALTWFAVFNTSYAGDGAAQGVGHVVSVDAKSHTIKLKHEPIKALGWPAMTMQFTADSSVDLSNVEDGDAVSFTLKPAGKDDYTIVSLKKEQ